MTVRCGHFELERKIGEGASGEVWRARHLDQQTTVAIKLVVGLADADRDSQRRFRQEIRAHAALEHPGTLGIFDYSQTDASVAEQTDGRIPVDTPYIITELADGGTLEETPPNPDWTHLRQILHNILSALAYTHARGNVHRGLRPSNILWFEESTGDWRPTLGDPGVDGLVDLDTQNETDEVAIPQFGVPTYMAPEQFDPDRRRLGPETDLYRVGLLAWQWACGAPPYTGEDPVEVARSHRRRPLPNFEADFPVPEDFDRWVKRLLARDPENRFRRAADAACTLTDLTLDEAPADGGGGLASDSTANLPDSVARPDHQVPDPPSPAGPSDSPSEANDNPGPRPPVPDEALDFEPPPPIPEDWSSPYDTRVGEVLTGAGEGLFGMREIPFVGRESERDTFWRTFRQVANRGQPRILLVEGPPGSGKSRLVEWMARRAHETGAAEVLKGVHSRQGGPEVGLRGMAEDYLRTGGLSRDEAAEHIFTRLRRTIAGAVNERDLRNDAESLADLVSPVDPDDDASEAPRMSSLVDRYLAAGRLLELITYQRPVIVWLDDLQWGASSLAWLSTLARRDLLPGVMFVGTLRETDLPEPVEANLESLTSELPRRQLERLTVEAFDADAYGKLLGKTLPLDPDLVDRVKAETEQDPLFGVQLLSDWVSRGLLERDETGYRLDDKADDPIPDAMSELWQRRIGSVVESLDKNGYQSPRRAIELAAALGLRVDPDEWQRLGEHRDIDCRRRIMERLVEFGLANQQSGEWRFRHETLLASIEASARQRGVWQEDKRHCAELVSDLHPNRPDIAAKRRAEYLVDAGDIDEAVDALYEASRVAVSRGGNQALDEILDRREALMDRLELSGQSRPRMQNRIRRAEGARRSADNRQARKLLREAIRVCRRQDWKAELADALLVKGQVDGEEGDLDAALGAIEKAEAELEQLDVPVRLGQCKGKKLRPLRQLGRFEETFEVLDEMRELFEQEGLTVYLRTVESSRARSYLAKGQLEEAGRRYEKLRDWARRHGNDQLEAMTTHGLAETARMRNDLEEAREYYQQAGPMFRELGSHINLYICQIALGLIELARGEFDEAETRVYDLERQLTLSGSEVLLHQLDLLKAGVAADRGDWEWWDETVDELTDAYADRTLSRIYETAWALELVGDITAESGDPERSDRIYELAHTIYEHLDLSDETSRVTDKMTGV